MKTRKIDSIYQKIDKLTKNRFDMSKNRQKIDSIYRTFFIRLIEKIVRYIEHFLFDALRKSFRYIERNDSVSQEGQFDISTKTIFSIPKNIMKIAKIDICFDISKNIVKASKIDN